LDRRSDWDLLADRGKRLRVEGRVDALGITLMKLTRCGVPFRAAEGEFPSAGKRARRVEAVGTLRRDGDEYEFSVESLRFLQEDVAAFRLRRTRVRRGDVDALRKLGEEARGRAAFYEDESLDRVGLEFLRESLDAAVSRLGAEDGSGRLRLADEIEAVGGDVAEIVRLRHEGLRLEWRDRRGGTDPDAAAEFRRRVAKLLPGADVPGPAVGPGDGLATDRVRETYTDVRAFRVFREATREDRLRMARLFYERIVLDRFGLGDVAEEAIVSGRWTPPGDAGSPDAIADELSRLTPEREDLISALRSRGLQERFDTVEAATRDELDALTARLKAAGRGADADEAKLRWLAGRVAQLRFDGAAGLLRAARETLDVTGDTDAAVALLKEADEASPASADVEAAFTGLGYVRSETGKWVPKSETDASRIDQAIRAGRVVAG
ncbi:MAG: hypothetical protein AAGJ97_14670, partial [Planctomycetota bacterium]